MHSGSARWVLMFLVALGLGFMVIPAMAARSEEYEPPHSKPGPAVERIRFQSFHVDSAPASMAAGDMDFYIFSLKAEGANQLMGAQGINVYEAPASTISLLLNPSPALDGGLNPFSIREVRYALQYAVNRTFIAQEIYNGLAQPMLAHVGPYDFDYITVYDLLKEADITYDPEFARELVDAAMNKAGAILKDNTWHFNGNPVTLNFIIRTEDERFDIGNLIQVDLEALGFQVNANYRQFASAIQAVYGTDPQLSQWHLYTEGWGRGSAERYDFATINQMVAPWLGNMPGWQEVGFWQYENAKLDEVGKQLFRGNFRSSGDRDHLYQELTKLALNESVRIWLATVVNSFPALDELNGVTEDITAGPKSIWTLREAYIPGKDTLTVGTLWVWTERTTWNPIGGFGDVYSSDIWHTVHDPPLWRDPFTGVPAPFRATYEVDTAGPDGRLDVPSDAFHWNANLGGFQSVKAGTQAVSKVTFDYSDYFGSNWHHGQQIGMADIVYSIFQSFDIAFDEDKSRIEFSIATTSRPFLETITGFRIVGDNKLEVYADYWHFVPDYIAEYTSLAGIDMPWEIMAAMDRMVFEDRSAAYSDTASQRFGVPWLNLVMNRDTKLIRRTLIELRDRGLFPDEVFQIGEKSIITQDEALNRYQAAIDWINEHDMAVISNGPFKLTRFDPPAQFAEVEAFRDPKYPFKPGDWFRGTPTPIQVRDIQTAPIVIGESAAVDLNVQGPGQIVVRYMMFDPVMGEVVTIGNASLVSDGQYSARLSEDVTFSLTPGLYNLFITAYSDEVSSVAERRLDVEVVIGDTMEQRQLVSTATTLTPTAQPAPVPTATSGQRGFSCSGPIH